MRVWQFRDAGCAKRKGGGVGGGAEGVEWGGWGGAVLMLEQAMALALTLQYEEGVRALLWFLGSSSCSTWRVGGLIKLVKSTRIPARIPSRFSGTWNSAPI